MPDLYMDVDTALAEVPVNILPLIDDTDFKSIEAAVAYNAAGMALIWHFVTTAGAMTETAVTPTSGGVHDWTDQGTSGLYALEIPASAGTINNDTEGFGWFTGVADGILPWRGPLVCFRAAALNNALIDGGDLLDTNVTQISGDTTAANNLEADYDGTGYAKANSTIGTTTTNTDMRGTNSALLAASYTAPDNAGITAIKAKTDDMVFTIANQLDVNTVAISNDAVAANNLEAGYDGTGYVHATAPATQGALATTDGKVDTVEGKVDAIDTNLNAVKAKTDDMVFTVANLLDVNMLAISGDTVAADNLESQYDTTGLVGDTFPATQAAVGNIASGTAATNVVASTAVVTTGTQTLTYTATAALDGVTHDIAPAGGNTDLYYQFDVGANGIPVAVQWEGYANAQGDSYTFSVYNWDAVSWDQVGIKPGLSGTTVVAQQLDLTNSHVGTGVNIGLVRLRIESSDGVKFATDRILCSYATVFQSVGYQNGAIWVDTVGGVAGTTSYINGVADNPVLTWADALTIATNMGLHKFRIANGSVITLSADTSNCVIEGENWTLALGGQTISGAYFHGAAVSGTGLDGGEDPFFSFCDINTVSLPGSSFNKCALVGPFTCTEAAIYFFEACFSGVAGQATPVIDFGAAIGNTEMNFRHYSGGIEIENMGQSGTDNMSLDGMGQYVLNANCVGGSLSVRGAFQKADNSGAVAITDVANIYSGTISAGRAQAATVNTITLAATSSAVDGAYDPAAIAITGGTGAGQSRMIYEYDGTAKVAVVDRDWKVNPDATSDYRITVNPGREHVNEGLAQAGAAGTITLNALASNLDDAYNNQICFIRSGTGEDQVGLITGYDGTTKVATLNKNWGTSPDATSGYAILPYIACDPLVMAALHNISPAEVNAEMVDVLSVDSYAEPTGAPGVANSLAGKIGYLYMALRNKMTVTATDKTFHDNGGNAEWSKSLSDDGTTYTEGEGS